jgi:hypothetical protein
MDGVWIEPVMAQVIIAFWLATACFFPRNVVSQTGRRLRDRHVFRNIDFVFDTSYRFLAGRDASHLDDVDVALAAFPNLN